MDTAPIHTDGAPAIRFDDEVGEQMRLAREADSRDSGMMERRRQRTLKALVDVDASRLIDDEAMRAWAESLGTDRELPEPQPG